MNPVTQFEAFNSHHWGALLAAGLILTALIAARKANQPSLSRALEITLGVILLLQWPVTIWVRHLQGTLDAHVIYPCQLCDLTAFFSALALFTHRQAVCELVYFWGLAGTLQGLLTPTLIVGFPNPRFILFFIVHGGVVVTALYCVLGLGKSPRAAAKWWSWGLINAYALMVGGLNHLLGTNFAFICRKPDTASLYDLLGPWPWYVGATSLLALLFFLLLDLPFILKRKRA
jgi:hypothetical integral membrane protein (TIGR02206 family)